MEKITVKMKIENISLTEDAWKNIDLILDSSERTPRDLFLGALIRSGMDSLVKDMKSFIGGEPMEDILKRVAKERGISETRAKEVDGTVEKDGLEGCFKRTV